MQVNLYNYLQTNMAQSPTDQLAALVRHAGILRSRDLGAIARQYLRLAEAQGKVTRVARGLYVATDADVTEHHDLALAAKRVPHGVVCLLSALRFHELTTQMPHEVWLAIDTKARLPKLEYPPLRIVRFSGAALTYGAVPNTIEGVTVPITTPAKTVADCFKYRNKIGLDVALEALRDCYRTRNATLDEIWQAAKVCRVANVIRPYMESLTWLMARPRTKAR
jgi:predicted transcriptional regulator of viral defense system